MKLEGSLDAFGLPDIFQLLSLTKKTGGLQLRSGASAGVVYFAGGSITGADSDLSRQTLARRVVGLGSVSDDVLVTAIERAKGGSVGVTRALLDSGAVDAGAARAAASDVTVDAVFELLSWPEGDFAFSVDAVNPDDLGVALATEQVVAQASTRQESIDAASDAVPSADVVLSLAASLRDDPSLSRDEWALLALADGRRTVTEIIDLTGRGYFAVVPSLAGLVRRGLLEVRAEGDDPAETVRRRLDLLAPLEGPPASGPRAPLRTPSAEPAAAPSSKPAAAVASAAVSTPVPDQPARTHEDEPAEQASELVATVGGPHVPTDVVPPRPEPFLAKRQPEHPEEPPADRPAAAAATRLAFAPAATAEASRSVFSSPVAATSGENPRAGGSSGSTGGAGSAGVGGTHGSAAMAADPETAALIERDPSVNRSLLLRLIAGVRGL